MLLLGSGLLMLENLPEAAPSFIQDVFCHGYACSDELLIQDAFTRLESGNETSHADGLPLLREGLRRDSASPYRWSDLGQALQAAGRLADARYCFSRALKLGPHLPPILLRSLNFHLMAGENKEVLSLGAGMLSRFSEYDAMIFSEYRRAALPINEILTYGIPAGSRAAQSFFGALLRDGTAQDVNECWNWLKAHSFTTPQLANEYARFSQNH